MYFVFKHAKWEVAQLLLPSLLREVSQLHVNTTSVQVSHKYARVVVICWDLVVFLLRNRAFRWFPNSTAVTWRAYHLHWEVKRKANRQIFQTNPQEKKPRSLWHANNDRRILKGRLSYKLDLQECAIQVAFPHPQLKAQVKHGHYFDSACKIRIQSLKQKKSDDRKMQHQMSQSGCIWSSITSLLCWTVFNQHNLFFKQDLLRKKPYELILQKVHL